MMTSYEVGKPRECFSFADGEMMMTSACVRGVKTEELINNFL
jgi:hypothetical protein